MNRTIRPLLRSFLLVPLLWLVGTAVAVAAPIELVATGTFDGVVGESGVPILGGTPFTVSVRLDPDTLGVVDSIPNTVRYDHVEGEGGVSIRTVVADYETTTAAATANGGIALSVRVTNDFDPGGYAFDRVRLTSLVELDGFPGTLLTFRMNFGGGVGVLSGTDISEVPWDLGAWSGSAAILLQSGSERSVGEISSLFVVPESSAATLMGIGLFVLSRTGKAHDRRI